MSTAAETAPDDCLHCAITIALVQMDGTARVCACGFEYARPSVAPPVLSMAPCAPCEERPARPRSGAVFRAPEGDTGEDLSPLERAGKAATRAKADDPELVRVRVLLCDLRPDCADPFEPPPKETVASHAPPIRVPSDSWGGLPKGFGGGLGAQIEAAEAAQLRTLVDVRARLDTMPPDARAVLSWLRNHATLREGLRGLYVDVGTHFAGEAQREAWKDLTARRDGAAPYGRGLVLGAARAWEAGR